MGNVNTPTLISLDTQQAADGATLAIGLVHRLRELPVMIAVLPPRGGLERGNGRWVDRMLFTSAAPVVFAWVGQKG